MDILTLILREIFEKARFDEFKENNPDVTSFIYLIKSAKDIKNFEEILYQSWTEILYQIPNLGCFKVIMFLLSTIILLNKSSKYLKKQCFYFKSVG